ncbi:MAG: hypothetical protein U0163_18715 [Gemmatimonadaceae bacterium]
MPRQLKSALLVRAFVWSTALLCAIPATARVASAQTSATVILPEYRSPQQMDTIGTFRAVSAPAGRVFCRRAKAFEHDQITIDVLDSASLAVGALKLQASRVRRNPHVPDRRLRRGHRRTRRASRLRPGTSRLLATSPSATSATSELKLAVAAGSQVPGGTLAEHNACVSTGWLESICSAWSTTRWLESPQGARACDSEGSRRHCSSGRPWATACSDDRLGHVTDRGRQAAAIDARRTLARSRRTPRRLPLVAALWRRATMCPIAARAGARARVRWAYPLLVLALWCSVAAMFLIALQIPRKAGVRLACSIVAVAFGAGGILVMLRDVQPSSGLSGITATFGRVGSWSAAIAAGLGLVAAGLQGA